jgi:hypothetical protein
MVVCFAGKAPPAIHNFGNLTGYFTGKLGKIDKAINNVAGHVDSMTGMFPQELKENIEHSTGRVSTSDYFGYAIDQLGRNIVSGYNNKNIREQANQAAAQLLSALTSKRNI